MFEGAAAPGRELRVRENTAELPVTSHSHTHLTLVCVCVDVFAPIHYTVITLSLRITPTLYPHWPTVM